MESATPIRRSGRTRTANKKYSIDPFEGLDILDSNSEDEAGTLGQEDSAHEEEFVPENAADAADAAESPEADDFFLPEGSEASDGSGVGTPGDDDEDAMSTYSLTELPKAVRGKPSSTGQKSGKGRKTNSQTVHVRGLPDSSQFSVKDLPIEYLFGSGTEELFNLVRSRDKWAGDPTLPTRSADSHGAGGMCHSFSHTEDKRTMEATAGWDWYYELGGRDNMTRRQRTQYLTLEQAHMYMPQPTSSSQSFLMGPYGQQTLYTLETGEVFNLADAWDRGHGVSSQAVGKGKPRKGKREGWILNIGRKIQCMDWAPNQGGNVQLLAIATHSPDPKAQNSEPQPQTEPRKAPAFSPAAPTPGCVQIWAFSASTEPGREGCLDMTRLPKLQMVICAEWGDAKHLKWCPTPRDRREVDGDNNIALGLLAGIWADGRVKVLDLRIATNWDSPTQHGECTTLFLALTTLTSTNSEIRLPWLRRPPVCPDPSKES